ncbi:MAG: right-handed parallel beta-helix repeat-containing protein, partial [Phycisphaerales bacterium]
MKKLMVALIFVLPAVVCAARTITVDNDGPADFSTIQAAIDDANDGDTVVVSPGTYTGDGNRDMDFLGKAITVRSTDPNDPDVVAATVIDCQGSEADNHRGFYFHTAEDANSVLAGLTITNAYAYGGGVFCYKSGPTIRACVIIGNYGTSSGGGIDLRQRSNVTIDACTIQDNQSSFIGGGIWVYGYSTATVTNCVIAGNLSPKAGAGVNVSSSSLTMVNCSIVDNTTSVGGAGGIDSCTSSTLILRSCIIAGNSSARGSGGGIRAYGQNSQIINCTIVNNNANYGEGGGGIAGNAVIANSIVWGNYASGQGGQVYGATASYCDIQGGFQGIGNIDAEPKFVNEAARDYHLSVDSPCINAGDPGYVPPSQAADIDGQARVMGPRVDIGADEFFTTVTPFIALSHAKITFYTDKAGANPFARSIYIRNTGAGSLDWQISETCPWLHHQPQAGTSTGEPDEVALYANTAGLAAGKYNCDLTVSAPGCSNSPQIVAVELRIQERDELLVPSQYATIQAAIHAAVTGDQVIIAPGTYTGDGNRDIDFLGKAITVRSIDPNDPDVVAATIIDCQGSDADRHRGFHFRHGEKSDSVLSGLTITNGYVRADKGGAILCSGASPTIGRCRITANKSAGFETENVYGGAIACTSGGNPAINDCLIFENWAGVLGHGWRGQQGSAYGGGIYIDGASHPVINRCTISGNLAEGADAGDHITDYEYLCGIPGSAFGGGICGRATIRNSVIRNNLALGGYAECGDPRRGEGGGIYCPDGATLINCLIMQNQVANAINRPGHGCGIFGADMTISNCTILKNQSSHSIEYSDGIYCQGPATITNCIVWDNIDDLVNCSATYSCIEDDDPGIGNIHSDPCFTDDYHLHESSYCVDAGDPAYTPMPGETDIDGEPRIMGARLDIGADELTAELAPAIAVSSSSFEFPAYESRPNPPDQVLTVGNAGGGTLNWTIQHDCAWLTVEPSSGACSDQSQQVILAADAAGLGPGAYNCSVTISDPLAVNSPRTINVTLNVSGPLIEISPDQFLFHAVKGEPDPAPQILQLQNSG